MNGQVASALPANAESTLTLVGPATQARAHAALKRFEAAIQSVLDAPLDAARVAEWTSLRAVGLTS